MDLSVVFDGGDDDADDYDVCLIYLDSGCIQHHEINHHFGDFSPEERSLLGAEMVVLVTSKLGYCTLFRRIEL